MMRIFRTQDSRHALRTEFLYPPYRPDYCLLRDFRLRDAFAYNLLPRSPVVHRYSRRAHSEDGCCTCGKPRLCRTVIVDTTRAQTVPPCRWTSLENRERGCGACLQQPLDACTHIDAGICTWAHIVGTVRVVPVLASTTCTLSRVSDCWLHRKNFTMQMILSIPEHFGRSWGR